MKSLVFDTNPFLRFLLNDIPEQTEQVTQLLIKAKTKEINIFVSQIVIFEIEFALRKYYKFPKNEVIEKLRTILTTPYLKVQDIEIFQEAIPLYFIKNIDFVDCFLLINAKRKNSKIFTFDEGLKKM